jgi:lipopolysaccharide assembly protein A
MRFVYIGLIVLVTVIVLAFKIQNLETATVGLFGMSMTLPTSILILLVYVLGMLTGGFVVNLLRTWVRGATERKA